MCRGRGRWPGNSTDKYGRQRCVCVNVCVCMCVCVYVCVRERDSYKETRWEREERERRLSHASIPALMTCHPTGLCHMLGSVGCSGPSKGDGETTQSSFSVSV